MSDETTGELMAAVDERLDDEFDTPVYVAPEPTAGAPRSVEQELADLTAIVKAQSEVINTLAASCDWLVQNLTQVFQFVAAMQSAGGPMAMMKMMSGGNGNG